MSDNEFGIILTDAAVKRIKQLTEDPASKHSGKKLRISIKSGGCSGLLYKYELVQKLENGDIIVAKDDVIVGVDEFSAEYMEGSQIHFDDSEFSKSSFEVINPNKGGGCGCGKSFSI
jgi:iron-sulfur cluster assembly accessory protein